MKRFYYLLSSIAVIVLITVACEKSSFDDSSIESLNHKVSAKGDQKSFIDGEGTTFVFHASINEKHGVKGEWVERDLGLDTLSSGSIDCLMFYSSNTAFARGTVEWTKDGEVRLTNVYFKLVDDEVDEFSGYVFSDESVCESVFLSTSVISSGDVKVMNKGDVAFQEEAEEVKWTHIPDANFRIKLLELDKYTILADGENVLTSDISSIDTLDISGPRGGKGSIEDLTGIEDFVGLTALRVGRNLLNNLDVSSLVNLTYLAAPGNNLTSLDISKNTLLETFFCMNNQLTSLVLSENTNLIMVSCYNNPITCIKVNEEQEQELYLIKDSTIPTCN